MPLIRTKNTQNPRILSISGLKIIAMFLIFWWHSDLQKPPVDLGARACEFFFAAAGFLFYYAHQAHPVPCTVSGVYHYVKRKVASIWPIHFLCFLLTLLYIQPSQWLCRDGLLMSALNLSLTHAFINNAAVFHSFNGVSWFCSAIVFCYVMAPFIARILRTPGKSIPVFAASFAMRFMIEWVQTVKPGAYWNVNVHVFPLVRLLEFMMGMACAAMYLSMFAGKEKQPGVLLCTGLEAGALILTVALMISMQGQWLRAMFLLPFCLLLFVFAFDRGLLSQLLSIQPVQFFAAFQLEFFVIHQVMFRLIQRFYPTLFSYPKREFAVCLILTTGLAILYRRYLQKPLSNVVSAFLDRVYRFLAA